MESSVSLFVYRPVTLLLWFKHCCCINGAALSWFLPGGKPTNGGSVSWCRGSSDRSDPVLRRPADQDCKQEVKKPRNLFISQFVLLLLPHLHWTAPNHGKLNFCSFRCTWSPATRRQMDVPRFREKANLLGAHITSSHWHKLRLTLLKNINNRLLFSSCCFYFIFF